jgi:hypothetical protein
MAQPAKAQEPSMEEILASIRRIISDDDTPKAPPPIAAAPPPRSAAPPPRPPSPLPPPPAPSPAAEVARKQNDIDAMLAQLNTPAQPEPVAEEPASDILDLTEAMAEPPPPPAAPARGFRTIDAQSDVFFEEAEAPSSPEPLRRAAPESEQLISRATSAAVDQAFNTLAQTVLIQNARTLEDLVREMLRPLLKSWLDDNLPGLVERLVRSEIERVSRGRNNGAQ